MNHRIYQLYRNSQIISSKDSQDQCPAVSGLMGSLSGGICDGQNIVQKSLVNRKLNRIMFVCRPAGIRGGLCSGSLPAVTV